jgi:hypothetical protein
MLRSERHGRLRDAWLVLWLQGDLMRRVLHQLFKRCVITFLQYSASSVGVSDCQGQTIMCFVCW